MLNKHLISAVASVVAVPLLVLPVLAQENSKADALAKTRKQTLTINVNGVVNLNNGEVTSVASSSLKVKVWGIEFAVNVSDATKLTGKDKATLADFKVGDRVKVVGKMTGDLTLTARVIHNFSAQQRRVEELRAKRLEAKKKKEDERKKRIEERKKVLEERKQKRKEKATSTPTDSNSSTSTQ